jgi:hypothetical protein
MEIPSERHSEDEVENSQLMLARIRYFVKSNLSTSRICRGGVIRTGFA